MATLKRRVVVVFSLVRYRRLGDFRYKTGGISADIAAATGVFATPVPTVLVVNGHITAFDAAQVLVETRAINGVATRNAAYNVVVDDMRAWLRYVQALIDAEPDPEQQLIIANSSGFDVRVNGVYIKSPFKVTQLPTPGMVKLAAISAGSRAAYNWQVSSNNGATWADLPITNIAKTTATGLTSGARYIFRFRSVVKNVVSGWCLPVSIVMQ